MKKSYQQRSRREYVDPATGNSVSEQFPALTIPKSSETRYYPMNEQTLLRGLHEVLRLSQMSIWKEKNNIQKHEASPSCNQLTSKS